MIKPPQVLLVATALLGCATQEQKSAAVDDWGDCVRSAVERVDDGKTDPMSVADGISAMCAAFYDKVRASQIKVRQSSGAQKGQDANLKEGELRMIVSAILDHRAKREINKRLTRPNGRFQGTAHASTDPACACSRGGRAYGNADAGVSRYGDNHP